MSPKISLVAGCLLLIASLGCGGSVENKVFGTVEFEDGAPLDVGELIFDDGSYSDIAPINKKGEFSVEKGLPKGQYKVTLAGVTLPDAKGNYQPIVAKHYLDFKTTDLTLTVPQGPAPVKFVVKKPK